MMELVITVALDLVILTFSWYTIIWCQTWLLMLMRLGAYFARKTEQNKKMCFSPFPGARARLRRHPHALRALQRTADEHEGEIGKIDFCGKIPFKSSWICSNIYHFRWNRRSSAAIASQWPKNVLKSMRLDVFERLDVISTGNGMKLVSCKPASCSWISIG